MRRVEEDERGSTCFRGPGRSGGCPRDYFFRAVAQDALIAQRAAAGKGRCRAGLVFADTAAPEQKNAEVEAARGIAPVTGLGGPSAR